MCPLMSNLAPTSAAERYFLASKPEVFEAQAKSLSVSFDASGPDTFLFCVVLSTLYIVPSVPVSLPFMGGCKQLLANLPQ